MLDSQRRVVDADLPDADVVVATLWETSGWVALLAPSKGRKVYFVQGREVYEWLPQARSRATYRLPLHKIVVSKWLDETMQMHTAIARRTTWLAVLPSSRRELAGLLVR